MSKNAKSAYKIGYNLDTVALEGGFGLKGEPPSDNTSVGTKSHQLSLSISINQCSGRMGPDEPDEYHCFDFWSASLRVTLCLFVKLSLWGVCYARWAAGGGPASYSNLFKYITRNT